MSVYDIISTFPMFQKRSIYQCFTHLSLIYVFSFMGFESPLAIRLKGSEMLINTAFPIFLISKYQIICLLLFTSGFLTVIMVKPEFKMRRFSPLKTRVKKPKTKGTKADSVEKVTVAELLPSLENTVLNKN